MPPLCARTDSRRSGLNERGLGIILSQACHSLKMTRETSHSPFCRAAGVASSLCPRYRRPHPPGALPIPAAQFWAR